MSEMIMGYNEGEDTVDVFHVTAVHAQEHAVCRFAACALILCNKRHLVT